MDLFFPLFCAIFCGKIAGTFIDPILVPFMHLYIVKDWLFEEFISHEFIKAHFFVFSNASQSLESSGMLARPVVQLAFDLTTWWVGLSLGKKKLPKVGSIKQIPLAWTTWAFQRRPSLSSFVLRTLRSNRHSQPTGPCPDTDSGTALNLFEWL